MRRNPPTDTWTCHQHGESRLTTHRHNTTPPSLDQAAHLLSPNATTATKRQTHIPLSPCYPELVKPNPVTHSPQHLPPRPEPNTHTPHTPLISSMLPALDKTPEPCVPPMYAFIATTPPPDPTPALSSPSHPNSLAAYTYATKTTIHTSQSPQQPHPQHRVPRQSHRQTKHYHRTTDTTQAHRPISESERNLIILQVNINGLKTN